MWERERPDRDIDMLIRGSETARTGGEVKTNHPLGGSLEPFTVYCNRDTVETSPLYPFSLRPFHKKTGYLHRRC